MGTQGEHTLAAPPPPQISLFEQVPQLSVPPQPSEMCPQFLPWALQVVGLQQMFLSHFSPIVQLPQLSFPPQPSSALPHCRPSSAQVLGTQALHTLFEQISPGRQLPQLSFWPVQLLVIVPQFLPWFWHSAGGGGALHTLLMQVSPLTQPPQLSVPPHPSEICPHSAFWSVQVVFLHVWQVCVNLSQAMPEPHAPQSIVLPQPSGLVPQSFACAHVIG